MSKGSANHWHLDAVSHVAGAGWGVRIAVLDTGIAPHPEISAQVAESWAIDEGRAIRLPYLEDSVGHGTAIAGLIAGCTLGVAPAAGLLSILLLDGGEAEPEDYVAAFQLAQSRGAQIANLSAGLLSHHERVVRAARDLARAGILLVTAAGNEGPSRTRCPGGIKEVLTVGACRADGSVPAFSGARADLHAPGVDVWTCVAPAGYGFRSGTSMAAAIVSGLAARLLETEGPMSPTDLKHHLSQRLRIE